MYNIIHLASTPGLRDSTRRARPVARPARASHFTPIGGGRDALPRRRRGAREVVPPPSRPSPGSG